MPRIVSVEHARKPHECGKCSTPIAIGDPYIHWAFRVSVGKSYSSRKHVRCAAPACQPKPSELTQSEFLSTLYQLQERFDEATSSTELEEIASELRELGESCQEKYDNMPDGLQQGDTGQMLENRASACEEAASSLEDAASNMSEHCDVADEKDDKAVIAKADEYNEEREENEEDSEFAERIREAAREAVQNEKDNVDLSSIE